MAQWLQEDGLHEPFLEALAEEAAPYGLMLVKKQPGYDSPGLRIAAGRRPRTPAGGLAAGGTGWGVSPGSQPLPDGFHLQPLVEKDSWRSVNAHVRLRDNRGRFRSRTPADPPLPPPFQPSSLAAKVPLGWQLVPWSAEDENLMRVFNNSPPPPLAAALPPAPAGLLLRPAPAGRPLPEPTAPPADAPAAPRPRLRLSDIWPADEGLGVWPASSMGEPRSASSNASWADSLASEGAPAALPSLPDSLVTAPTASSSPSFSGTPSTPSSSLC